MNLSFINLHRCEEQLQQKLQQEGVKVYVETKSAVDIIMKDFPHRREEYQKAVANAIPLNKIHTDFMLKKLWGKKLYPLAFFRQHYSSKSYIVTTEDTIFQFMV